MADGYFCVPVSVDALEWTEHWLGRQRCDLLVVFLAQRPNTLPRVRFVAVESKTIADSEPIGLSVETEPFKKAVAQVVDTLDALSGAICHDAATSLIADLKLSALIEHLMSEVLARISPISGTDLEKIEVLKTLTKLSQRQLVCDEGVTLEGLAVVTQSEATVQPTETTISVGEHPWRVKLVRCGVPTLRQLFEAEGLIELADEIGVPAVPEDVREPAYATPSSSELAAVAEPIVHRYGKVESDVTEAQREQLLQLDVACKSRGFRIGSMDDAVVFEGPALMAVSLALASGESIRPIQIVSADIARELGVRSVGVENDPDRPYHVRFLIPRRARTFPRLPDDLLPLVDDQRQQYLCLWLGALVDGTPYRTAISDWPHLLIAGTTGSGKTTFLKSILSQLNRLSAGDVELAVVDGKSEYDYIDVVAPELLTRRFPEIQLGHAHAPEVLQWLIEEEIVRRRGALTNYFKTHPSAPRAPKHAFIQAKARKDDFPLSPVVVIIDEFAEIMAASGAVAAEFSQLVQRAVQGGRSALVHLVLATQRPDASVLPGSIKANLPSRVALQLPSHHDSMTVLNSAGAEDLLGSGDLVYQSATGERVRLQGYLP
jgi:S-DNA-T family DNA segregation ATPase FtsK/SpoIIIE